MEWSEFSVLINREAEEAVSNVLMELGSSGVSIMDKAAFDTLPEYRYETLWALDESKYPIDQVMIKGYFYDVHNQAALKQHIEDYIIQFKSYDALNITSYTVHYAVVNEEDWSEAWKAYYHPVQLSRFMTIVPQWEDYTPHHEDERMLVLDPGLAFGTGTHPTTQLSAQLIETVIRGGETLIDVGTGSGVLSIAAASLGADKVYAYDIDDVAITAAKSNIRLNHYEHTIDVSVNDLLKNVTHTADIVVANILADIILPMISDAYTVLKPGGYFVTSGIIDKKKHIILESLDAEGFVIDQINQSGDWVGILARKPHEFNHAKEVTNNIQL